MPVAEAWMPIDVSAKDEFAMRAEVDCGHEPVVQHGFGKVVRFHCNRSSISIDALAKLAERHRADSQTLRVLPAAAEGPRRARDLCRQGPAAPAGSGSAANCCAGAQR